VILQSSLGTLRAVVQFWPMAAHPNGWCEMWLKKETTVARKTAPRDPFAMFKQMTADFDRIFGEGFWPSFRLPLPAAETFDSLAFTPAIDVFEKDNRLVTKIDLPGMKKEDVKVEVADGYLAISGERKNEVEEKKDGFYRCERGYGTFYRALPLPESVKLEDVKATFLDGVLEVSVPMAEKPKAQVRRVEILEPGKPSKAA
jgi:HSP20 family protein